MADISFSVPTEVKKIVKRHSEIKWERIAKEAVEEHAKKLKLMDNLVANSKLTQKDVDELDHIIKESILKRYSR